jgi:hypothetical protein
MSNLQSLLQATVDRWRTENIPISPGVDTTILAGFEARYGVTLPQDMREFYSTVNGMGGHYDESHFFRFWPIEEVTPVSSYMYGGPDIVRAIPELAEYFLFFDHSVDLWMYAIRLNQDANLATPIRGVYPELCSAEFRSFTGFVTTYVDQPDDLF